LSENILNKKQFGTNSNDVITSLKQDSITKDIYSFGTTWGNLFGMIYLGLNDVFIIKYYKDFNQEWAQLLGTTNSEEGYSITIDSQYKYIYVGGYTLGSFHNSPNNGGKYGFCKIWFTWWFKMD